MKVITKLIGTLIKAMLALLILALLAPILYFAWRANQPMDMPEFKGLTLVQYEDWRKMIYEKNEDEFALAHPDRIVKQGVCFKADLTVQASMVALDLILWIGIIPLAILDTDAHEQIISDINSYGGPVGAVWAGVEGMLVITAGIENRSQPWCNMKSASVPTPEQYEAMKQERAGNP